MNIAQEAQRHLSGHTAAARLKLVSAPRERILCQYTRIESCKSEILKMIDDGVSFHGMAKKLKIAQSPFTEYCSRFLSPQRMAQAKENGAAARGKASKQRSKRVLLKDIKPLIESGHSIVSASEVLECSASTVRRYVIREGGELLQTARENGKYRRANGVKR